MRIPDVFSQKPRLKGRQMPVFIGLASWKIENTADQSLRLTRDLSRGRTLRIEFKKRFMTTFAGVYIDDVLLDWYRDTSKIADKDVRSIIEVEFLYLIEALCDEGPYLFIN